MDEKRVSIWGQAGSCVATVSVLLILLMPGTSEAQVKPGKFRIGAGIGGFAYSNLDVDGEDVETKEFAVAPSGDLRIGYVLTDIFEVGLDFGLTHADIEVDSNSGDATAWRIGPYTEANLPVNEKGTLLLAPGIGVSYSNMSGTEFDFHGFEFTATATLKYFVVENASIDIGLQFTYFVGDADVGDVRRNADTDGFQIGPRVGISIWF